MKKIKDFLRKIDISDILGVVTDLYLLILILSNLYLLTQAKSYFVAGKYGLSTILAIIFAILLHFLQESKKGDK